MTRSITTGVAAVVAATAVLTAGGVIAGEVSGHGTAPDAGFEPELVSREPCPESRFECVTITVPRDHGRPDGDTWQVTYAIQRATGTKRGTFVTITGGPGSAGIASADSYTDVMSPDITDHYDIVFLNQRGSGDFEPLHCDRAASDWYRTPFTVDDRDTLAEAVSGFVDACIDEGDINIADLPYYSTRQAAEDLELVRRHLGAEQLALYGESYGTQFVQTYAAAHPDRVAALFVDGVVDLTVDGQQWYAEAARAHHDALTRTLDACAVDDACASDAGTDDVGAAYDALAAQLDDHPIDYEFPLPDGTTAARQLTAADLSVVAVGNVGSFGARMQLLRVLNAALNGNPVPLGRMALQYEYLDPETLDLVVDPSWSDALYFAVECQDYAFYPDGGTPRQRLDQWLDHYEASGEAGLRLGNVALGDLPCLWWPAQPGIAERPAPITDPPYPTFVMTADADPATPMVNAMRVFERLDDAYLVVLQDGPHVIFDWGYSCVDDLVAGFLATGTPPPTRVTICDGDLTDPYVALAPDTPDELAALLADPAAARATVDEQLLNQVEYYLWPADDTLEFGCDFGGTATYSPTGTGVEITLDACELSDAWPVSGTGALDDTTGELDWDDLDLGDP